MTHSTDMLTENDGGREAAGYKGKTGDCVVRAVAIAARLDYQTVYDDLFAVNKAKQLSGNDRSPRHGVYTSSDAFKAYMRSLGFVWTPTMRIGSGCTVHLLAGELPTGRLVVSLSKHFCAVIDGVINDNSDPSRDGTRCVYGYWRLAQ